MLFYLDNVQNAAPGSKGPNGREAGLNENYARELMELHTLGVNGGYTQDDVISLARILTGWGFARPGQDGGLRCGGFRRMLVGEGEMPMARRGTFAFDPDRHD